MKHRRWVASRASFGSLGSLLVGAIAASACAVATEPTYMGDLSSSGGAGAGPINGSAGQMSSSGTSSVAGGGSPIVQGGAPGGAGTSSSGGAGSAGKPSGGSHAGGAAAGGAPGTGGTSSSAGTGGASGGSVATGGALGSGGSTATSHGFGDPWTFDTMLQGWAVRDHSANITTMPTAAAGVASFSGLPFSMASEYTDFAFSFGSDANLSGLKLHAKIRRVSGGFIGAQVYAYGGAWLGSTFTSLNSATFMDVVLDVPATASAGFDPTKVSRVGIKLNTGSNASNTFSATTIEIDEVTLE